GVVVMFGDGAARRTLGGHGIAGLSACDRQPQIDESLVRRRSDGSMECRNGIAYPTRRKQCLRVQQQELGTRTTVLHEPFDKLQRVLHAAARKQLARLLNMRHPIPPPEAVVRDSP